MQKYFFLLASLFFSIELLSMEKEKEKERDIPSQLEVASRTFKIVQDIERLLNDNQGENHQQAVLEYISRQKVSLDTIYEIACTLENTGLEKTRNIGSLLKETLAHLNNNNNVAHNKQTKDKEKEEEDKGQEKNTTSYGLYKLFNSIAKHLEQHHINAHPAMKNFIYDDISNNISRYLALPDVYKNYEVEGIACHYMNKYATEAMHLHDGTYDKKYDKKLVKFFVKACARFVANKALSKAELDRVSTEYPYYKLHDIFNKEKTDFVGPYLAAKCAQAYEWLESLNLSPEFSEKVAKIIFRKNLTEKPQNISETIWRYEDRGFITAMAALSNNNKIVLGYSDGAIRHISKTVTALMPHGCIYNDNITPAGKITILRALGNTIAAGSTQAPYLRIFDIGSAKPKPIPLSGHNMLMLFLFLMIIRSYQQAETLVSFQLKIIQFTYGILLHTRQSKKLVYQNR